MPPGACPGNARGEAPCIRKLKSPPSPEGKGGGGMGAESKTKGKVGGRPTGHAPRRVPDWQVEPVPPGACPGDARGEAPCIRKLKSPPSPEGKGDRGMGARKQAKGKVGERPTGHAPPVGTCMAGTVSAASGSRRGCRGRSPLPGDCAGTLCRLHLTFADRAPYTCRRRHPRRNHSAWSGGARRQSCRGVRRARAPH